MRTGVDGGDLLAESDHLDGRARLQFRLRDNERSHNLEIAREICSLSGGLPTPADRHVWRTTSPDMQNPPVKAGRIPAEPGSR